MCFSVITAPNRPTTPLTTGALVPPPRPSSRPKLPTGKLTGINEIVSLYPCVCVMAHWSLLEWQFMFVMLSFLVVFASPRYGLSARLRHPTPAPPLLPHSPEQRALLHCRRTPHSVLGTPRLLVRFLYKEPLFLSSFLSTQFSDFTTQLLSPSILDSSRHSSCAHRHSLPLLPRVWAARLFFFLSSKWVCIFRLLFSLPLLSVITRISTVLLC